VEQKTSSLIPACLGYERLDRVQQTLLLNRLYSLMGRYTNLFLPVLRLSEKILIPAVCDQPARIRRRHGPLALPLIGSKIRRPSPRSTDSASSPCARASTT
jgi:hypothetical protein